MNEQDWNKAFDQYKQIGQYKHINFDYTLSDFKFIYFWEWFHRVWARLMGLVFAIGFVYFIIKKQFSKDMIWPMLLLFFLGGLQGAIGWIMVQSGLNDNDVTVSHIRLSIHFMAALGLLCYVFWFAISFLVPKDQHTDNPSLKSFSWLIIVILVVQLFYGAFMAGLKAGTAAPTWPMINGMWIPDGMGSSLTDDPITVQFIHRGLAYIIALMILVWWSRALRSTATPLFRETRLLPPVFVMLQVILGIFTVLYSPDKQALLWLGVAHQFVAMLLLLSMVWTLRIMK
jgi:cytochrome c oxidase assembly protein subunit 15